MSAQSALDALLKLSEGAKAETVSKLLPELFRGAYEARLLETELEVLWHILKKRTGVRVTALRKDWETYLATHDVKLQEEAAAAPVDPETERAAHALLHDPALLYNAVRTIGSLGVVGELANRGTLYLALTSRQLGGPISVLIKGRSAGGKSNLVKKALALMPPETYYEFTAMSAKALIYAEELELKHKHLVVYEEDGNQEAEYLVRTLLSEGRISYLTAEKGTKGIVTRHITREGPTGLITTLTKASVREDNETWAWSLYVDDSHDQTVSVVKALAGAAAGGTTTTDTLPWQVMQRALEPSTVVIPFAPALADALRTDALPSDSTRLRRDFARLLTLVMVIALLYQKQRQRDEEGKLIATLADYAMAHRLVAQPFAQSAHDLSPQAIKLSRAVRELHDTRDNPDERPLTTRDLEGYLRWSRATILKWLVQAEHAGLVEVVEGKGNRATTIKPIGTVLDETLKLLPTAVDLTKTLTESVNYTDPLTGETFTLHPAKRLNAKGITPSETEEVTFGEHSTAFSASNSDDTERQVDLNGLNAAKRSSKAEGEVPDANREVERRAFKHS